MIFGLDITPSTLFMLIGFLLALGSCVSNDVIQTLGTFLSSNEKQPWWIIWGYMSAILVATLTFGWVVNGGDMSFGRLDKIPFQEVFHWWHVLPPIVLLILTRFGMPVSTTFLLLSVFSTNTIMSKMILKSVMGYFVAFIAAVAIYMAISKIIENKFMNTNGEEQKDHKTWIVLQWLSTGFLWSQWIMHDVANMFVYLPRKIDFAGLIAILVTFVLFMAIIAFKRGGEIQKIVKLKTNTHDIRSATIIDFIYAIILLIFKDWNNIPMSTTWVFIGLLAGREVALYASLKHCSSKKMWKHIFKDFSKVSAGLVVSLLVVVSILHFNYIKTEILSLLGIGM